MEDLFVLPAGDDYLLYAPLQGVSALVNESFLRACKRGAMEPPWTERTVPPPKVRRGPLAPEFLGLITTRSCPLACLYCDFLPNGPSLSMSPILAREAVDWMVRHRLDRAEGVADIHFFGGEPLFSFPPLFAAVERCAWWSNREEIRPWFEVSTCGFFSEERLSFLKDHIHVAVLSLDGPPDIQDKYRPTRRGKGSSERTMETAASLRDSPVKLCLRSCITQETARRMGEIAAWICESFRPSILCFEPLKRTSRSDRAGLLPPDPFEFARGFFEASLRAESDGVETVYGPASIKETRNSFCPVGRDSLVVGTDGLVSSCYLLPNAWEEEGLDLSWGRFEPGRGLIANEESVDRVRKLGRPEGSCLTCFARWHCAGGCHVEKRKRGGWKRTDAFCIQTRLICAWKLLRGLGQHETAAGMVDYAIQGAAWVEQKSDRLEDWTP